MVVLLSYNNSKGAHTDTHTHRERERERGRERDTHTYTHIYIYTPNNYLSVKATLNRCVFRTD